MTVKRFWEENGVSAAVSARAEEALRENEALLSGLPLGSWRTAPYEEGYPALREALGEDEDGMKLFAAQSMEALLALHEYEERGIGHDIFLATMAFMARFSKDAFARRGRAEWTWGWWFPRQLALKEFRLGALEYEMTEGAAFGGKPSGGNKRRIFLHIPADADLSDGAVDASLAEARAFFCKYFPAFADAEHVCESWMLSPALGEILPETSRVRRFSERFSVVFREEDSPAFRDWIFPSAVTAPVEELPEETSLQRAVKRHLLAGGKIGWAEGVLNG